ncbi:MAG: IPT/TIG domain-containing protein [Ferruginibacter sp.]|nr:IPT/TIG domain-containing protein [Cytophagales bacterium]
MQAPSAAFRSPTSPQPEGPLPALKKLLLGLALAVVAGACEKEPQPAAVITAVTPARALPGTVVTITGYHFGSYPEDNDVYFGDVKVQGSDWIRDKPENRDNPDSATGATPTELILRVPAQATSGPLTIQVYGQTTVATFDFTVVNMNGVAITALEPASGPVGSTVTIRGRGFNADEVRFTGPDRNSRVRFGTREATVVSASDEALVVIVPNIPPTDPQSVTVALGFLTSNSDAVTGPIFTLTPPPPTVAGISPESGSPGSVVTITGTNFSPTVSDNAVTVNGLAVSVTSATATQLTVLIPFEATSGPIQVSVRGQSVTGPNFEVVAPPAASLTIYYTAGAGAGASGDARVVKANVDASGTVTQTTLFGYSINNQFDTPVGGIALDIPNNKIYVPSRNRIWVGNTDGTGFRILYTLPISASGIDIFLFEGQLYWANRTANTIVRANADGTGPVETLFGDNPNERFNFTTGVDLEVANRRLYWTSPGSAIPTSKKGVYRGNLDGSGEPELLYDETDGLLSPYDIDIDVANGKIYVADNPGALVSDRIIVGNLDGTGALTTLFSGTGVVVNASYLEIADGQLYWMNSAGGAGTIGAILRGNLDGSGTPETLINNIPRTGTGNGGGLAIDKR